jgi:DNA-binding MarR family transcriptional regulator
LTYLDIALAIALGVALGVVAVLLWDRLRHRPELDRSAAAMPPPSAPVLPLDPKAQAVPAIPAEAESRAPAPPRTARSSHAPSLATLKLSQRIVLHVYAQGRPTDYLAPASLSQGGMSKALGVPQNHLANALARLEAGGVLIVSRRHVSGGSRRVQVYTLTPLGEALARDLRKLAPPGDPPAVPAWMGRP